ncbi:MAG: hypothetical protein M3032_02335 [Verrucomicrobiota bacterium]|nr:hypothetical protein [Verrucomicrobiota bacterium]
MIPTVTVRKTHASPAPTPQALAWHAGRLWMGSRDLRRIYEIDPGSWQVMREAEPPGIPWAAASAGDSLFFTLGEGPNDDRYIRRFVPGEGFAHESAIECPDFTGSYLSHNGEHLYLSQWYEHRILQLDETGKILRTIDIGAEISGHTFANGLLFVLRGTEQNGEHWHVAVLDPAEDRPEIKDLAHVPFACRSLAFDGESFWSNHRAAGETVSFTLPE